MHGMASTTEEIRNRIAQDGDKAHRRVVNYAEQDLLFAHIQEEVEARGQHRVRRARSRVSSMGGSCASSVSSHAASSLVNRLDRVLAERDLDDRGEGRDQGGMQGKEVMALVAIALFPPVALCAAMLALLYVEWRLQNRAQLVSGEHEGIQIMVVMNSLRNESQACRK